MWHHALAYRQPTSDTLRGECLPLPDNHPPVYSSRVGATPYFMLEFHVCSTMSCLATSVSQLFSSSPSFYSSLCSLFCDAVWALNRGSQYSWSSAAEQSQLLSLARWPILSFCVNHSCLQKEVSLTKVGSNYTMRINIWLEGSLASWPFTVTTLGSALGPMISLIIDFLFKHERFMLCFHFPSVLGFLKIFFLISLMIELFSSVLFSLQEFVYFL